MDDSARTGPRITGTAMWTCHGDEQQTWDALLAGRCGSQPLHVEDPLHVGVSYGYQIDQVDHESDRAATFLERVLRTAVAQDGAEPVEQPTLHELGDRVVVLVGTGLREARSMERAHVDGAAMAPERMHFARIVRRVLPEVSEVVTIANACAASGNCLALAVDLLDLGEADAVVVAGTDSVTRSMLAMIGWTSPERTGAVRPFDRDRTGVLLGEGAACVVLRPGPGPGARVRGVGMGCDAFHETALDPAGIERTMVEAYDEADLTPDSVDLVLAHGTGTALNDPAEATALANVHRAGSPLVTGLKGSIGHTSGGAFLMNLIVAVRALRTGLVPAVAGLHAPIGEADGVRLVREETAVLPPGARPGGLAQVDAFGFGGTNAVALVEV